ncbi:S8 family serine peptidase [Rossellomorea aquimaris]|uniref:S8 family serine peptidase n=1 Tax=Rossellomorea aquimaris TaxID=189382 RepID=A0A5D4U8S6_9BACI|nr:S8 family serine peptidase [Rossellomorea aquimaris]TYS76723.1 S8 family serine peptidase [Rossellomorea aquimaris]TYS83628.1 S8 family serine peptidase [Rossellomorea aquimaris]TYS89177.1 S8 family serine peptidase [Rossellomorea aquimaris]
MNKGKLNPIIKGTLIASLLVSAGVPSGAIAEENFQNKQKSVEKMLMNLTDQQRKALKELEISPGFTISPEINQNSSEMVDVIVEFNQAPAKVAVAKQAVKGKRMSLSSAKEKTKIEHESFKKEWKKVKSLNRPNDEKMGDAKITREFHETFNGVAMTLPGRAVQELLSTGVVKRIWKDNEVKVDLPQEVKEMNSGTPSKVDDSLPQIGADKLHEENIIGTGVKVGVIDTGVDYNHPDLKGVFKGGYDFVDNDSDPMETTLKDWKDSGKPEFNGSSYYTFHGTHVAGSIAGQKENSSASSVKGVAPGVDLYAYRVLGPYGSGSNAAVMAGIEKAVTDGMDVINLSLGSNVNEPLNPTSIAINNAMLSGVVAVVAAGNNGPGEKTLGSPGAAALGITVGASDVSLTIPTISASAGDQEIMDMKLLARNYTDNLEDLQDMSLPIVEVGIGKVEDFNNKDVAGKVAIIERGAITFDEKIQNAKDAGAKAAIVYNNVDGEIEAYIGEGTNYVPAFRISKAEGEQLKLQSEITFDSLGSVKTEGDHLAEFSSRGPANGNDDIKPDVVGPGVAILSTLPEFMNNPEDGENYDAAFGRLSGTSMASPHVAGAAALILQAHPEYTPFEVKEALMNTADEMNGEYSVNEVGAGRIDVHEAVHSDVLVKVLDKTMHEQDGEFVEIDEETGSIAFGSHFKEDDGQIEDSRKVVIQNFNEENAKEFTTNVEFLPAKGEIQDAGSNGVDVEIQSTVTIEAGESAEIEPTIRVSASAEFGRYEGYIHLVNSNNEEETYQIPFAIRVADKGFEKMVLTRPMITNDTSKLHPYTTPYTNAIVKLSSPLKTIDVLVNDGKSGEPIGLIGTLTASHLLTGIEYFASQIFRGEVYPFTNDPSNPVSDKKVKLSEGDYTFEMIGYDEQGKPYSKDAIVMIDNTPPKVELDMEPGLYEVNDSMFTEEEGLEGPAVWVHGNVYDSTVDALKEKGVNIDQSRNGVMWWEYSFYNHYFLNVDKDGNFRFPASKERIDQMTYLDSNLFVFDNATASEGYPESINKYMFIKAGTEYAVPSYDKEKVHLGDEITMTLNLNNVEQIASGDFSVPFNKNLLDFKNVKVNETFKQYAEQKGANVTLEEPTLTSGNVKVGASIDEGDLTMDKDLPFLDVTFKVINDEYYAPENLTFATTSFKYKKTSDSSPSIIRVLKDKSFRILAGHSVVNGNISPEAFFKENGQLDNSVDYSKLGAKVYAKGPNGKTYEASEIFETGYFTIDNLPLSEEEYEIYVEVPGHLTSKSTAKLVQNVDGDLAGVRMLVSMDKAPAGDLTGDKMVDIHDAIVSVFSYGKENLGVNKGDLNQDGVVDESDLRLIEKNFLEKGPDAKGNKKPKEKQGKVTLEKLFRSIGLETN